MKVIFLCGGSYVFGLETVALAVMRGLNERGHSVHCVVSAWNDGAFTSRLDEVGIGWTSVYLGKVSVSPHPRALWWTLNALYRTPGARRAIRCLLNTVRPDVVVACNRDGLILLGATLRRFPLVYHVQAVPEVSRWSRWASRLAGRHVSAYISASYFVADRLRALGAASHLVHVAYASAEDPGQSQMRPDRSPVRIGICGQVGAWKGHGDLIDALSILAGQRYRFRCLVFGSGDPRYLRELTASVKAAGLEGRVEWRGFVGSRVEMYRSIDIVVVPSRFGDPFPTTTLEASAHSLPVVGTLRGGLPEQIVDGVTGYLVEAAEPVQLADRIRRLLDSPELRRQMGAAGRTHVLTAFSVDRMLTDFDYGCRRAIRQHGGPDRDLLSDCGHL